MTPTLHPSRHRVDTFLVNEPLLPWSLRESVWARGMAHPQVVRSDHLPVRLALPGLLNAAGHAAMPTPYSRVGKDGVYIRVTYIYAYCIARIQYSTLPLGGPPTGARRACRRRE